ncbi:MAG: AsmA family protein [Deltaproteobacteria bacterium]|nr:AsmA family protein [Deltaproteobacteria bacterium]
MAKGKRKYRALRVIAGILAVLTLAVLALVLFVDIGRYRPRLETEASRILGLDVQIHGEMKIEYFPPLGVSLADIHVARRGATVVRVERMRAGLKILPLFLGRVRFREVELIRPQLSLLRTASGPFDFERYLTRPFRTAREALPGTFDSLDRFSVSGGIVSYASKDSSIRAEVDGLELVMRDITFREPPGEDLFRTVSFSGTVKTSRTAVGTWETSALAWEMTGKDGNYEVHPITLQAFGGTGEGSVWINLSVLAPLVHIQFSQTGSDIEQLFTAVGGKRGLLAGKADLSFNLFMKGKDPDALVGTMTGDLSWKGNDLKVPDFDPDAPLSAIRKGESAPLARMAALLLPGPLFTAAAEGLLGPDTKVGKEGEEGLVDTLASYWTVKDGMFEAEDVALATKGHRVALTGRIDLPGGQFDNIAVALVDDRGCARAGQTIQGAFRLPQIAETITAKGKEPTGETPAGEAREAAPGGECKVVYTGTVPPPN